MVESPFSPSSSSKALMSLSSSSSPSPITTLNQPISYENYQPYVLVKGSMEGVPRCSKAVQRKSCIEEGGIGLDEVSPKASSTPIPSMFLQHSKGTDYSKLQVQSLPSSPTKATATTSCSIEDLRAAINQMKESSKWHNFTKEEEDTRHSQAHLPLEFRAAILQMKNSKLEESRDDELCYAHLPMEFRSNEEYPTQSPNEVSLLQQVECKALHAQGMSKLESSVNSLHGLAKDERMKKKHHNTPEHNTLEYPPYYPDKDNSSGQYPSQVKPTKSTFQPFLPPPNTPIDQTLKPMDKAQANPLKQTNSNFPQLAENFDPFPPLGGSHQVQNDLNTHENYTSPSSPRAPWSQLFNSN